MSGPAPRGGWLDGWHCAYEETPGNYGPTTKATLSAAAVDMIRSAENRGERLVELQVLQCTEHPDCVFVTTTFRGGEAT